MSGKSEVMRCPLPISTLARTLMATSRGNINRDISRGRFENGIVALAASVDQFHGNSARAGFGARRRHAVQLNAATASLRLHMPLGRGQVNASTAGFDFRRTANVSQIDAATASGNLHLPVALAHLDAAAPGFDGRALACPD